MYSSVIGRNRREQLQKLHYQQLPRQLLLNLPHQPLIWTMILYRNHLINGLTLARIGRLIPEFS